MVAWMENCGRYEETSVALLFSRNSDLKNDEDSREELEDLLGRSPSLQTRLRRRLQHQNMRRHHHRPRHHPQRPSIATTTTITHIFCRRNASSSSASTSSSSTSSVQPPLRHLSS
jgi:hypothetical protein